MRLPYALTAAAAYAIGRGQSAAHAAPGAASEPAIVEPWRSAGIPEVPDPVAEFIFEALKPAIGATVPAAAVLDAYERWSARKGRPAAARAAVLNRLAAYATIEAGGGRHVMRGYVLHAFAAAPGALPFLNIRPTPIRAIPGLRARILADAALLSAELLAVLQSTRDVLEAATDEPGTIGDVVRIAAAMLDDVLADHAGTPDRTTA